MMEPNRQRAAEQAFAGTGLMGAGAALDAGLHARLKAKTGSTDSVLWTAMTKPKNLSRKVHLPHVAGKLGSRALYLAGIPLAVHGGENLIRNKPTRKIEMTRDVVKPVLRNATLRDASAEGDKRFGKSLDSQDAKRLDSHRKVGRGLSLTSGALGLAALGLRAPQAARAVTYQSMKRGKIPAKSVLRLAAKEKQATSLSNTLGVGAIGIGSAGSFNYAAQQRLERKRDIGKAATYFANPAALERTEARNRFYRRAVVGGVAGVGVGAGAYGVRAHHQYAKERAEFGKSVVGEGVKDLLKVHRFETVHPEGKNSLYTRMPNGKWLREKKATGTVHSEDKTVFVHPAYGQPRPHPTIKGQTYSPLTLAASHDELVHPGGHVGIKIAHPEGPSTAHSVPAEHISHEPREGWHPVEYSLHPDGRVKSYHLGHPVAPFKRGMFSSEGPIGKSLPKMMFHAGRWRRVLGYDKLRGQILLENHSEPHLPYRVSRGGMKPPQPPKYEQGELDFGKSDRFLHDYGDRISPRAETGYTYLREGRDRFRRTSREHAYQGAGSAALSGLSGWLTAHEIRRGGSKPAVAVSAASALASGVGAVHEGLAAHRDKKSAERWDAKMNKIKAKAHERAAAGLYGPGRGKSPMDTKSRARNLAIANTMAGSD